MASFTIGPDNFSPARVAGNFGELSSNIISILISVAGIISFIFIIIAGIRIILASGDEKQLAAARGTLTYAILGLAVAILALVIVNVLQYFLKADIPGI